MPDSSATQKARLGAFHAARLGNWVERGLVGQRLFGLVWLGLAWTSTLRETERLDSAAHCICRIARNTPLRRETKRLARSLFAGCYFLHATTGDSDSPRRVCICILPLKSPILGAAQICRSLVSPTTVTAPAVSHMRLLCLLQPSTSHVLRKRPSVQRELARLKLSSTPDVAGEGSLSFSNSIPTSFCFLKRVCGQAHDHWLSEFKRSFNSCDLVVAPRLLLFQALCQRD